MEFHEFDGVKHNKKWSNSKPEEIRRIASFVFFTSSVSY